MTPPAVAIHDWIRKGFQFQGRSSRSDYWWTRVLVFTLNLVLVFVFAAGLGPEGMEDLQAWFTALAEGDVAATSQLPLDWEAIPGLSKFALVFLLVFALLTFIPDISLSWRRFQDMNLPGWIHILFLIGGAYLPMVALAEMIWFIRRGTVGDNRYGPDPVRDA